MSEKMIIWLEKTCLWMPKNMCLLTIKICLCGIGQRLRNLFIRLFILFQSDVFLCRIKSDAAVLAAVSSSPKTTLSRVQFISVERYAAMPSGRCMATYMHTFFEGR